MDPKMNPGVAAGENKPENIPLYLFRSGKNRRSYEYMGVHKATRDGKPCMVARVWAPRAREVSLVGDFCNWDKAKYPLQKIDDQVWEGYTDFEFEPYQMYKFYIKTAQGEDTYKSDPYARHTETRPGTASRWYDLEGYQWHDQQWLEHKREHAPLRAAGEHLRGPRGLLAEVRGRQRLPLREAGGRAHPLRERDGLYPY